MCLVKSGVLWSNVVTDSLANFGSMKIFQRFSLKTEVVRKFSIKIKVRLPVKFTGQL